MYLKVKRLSPDAKLPTRTYEHDAGLDLYGLDGFKLPPRGTQSVSTGVVFEIPQGYVGLVRDRSSIGKKGVTVLAGVVDAGYRGEIVIVLHNLSAEVLQFEPGAKIAQILLLPVSTMPVLEVEELDSSERGERGFGSSGE
ncbi:dUTP diphosphatase [Candidatus Acetothermia bacterium]|nr:dUTP diphosphatase [Candidatus Acetothermia bacterium]MBI3642910.1 dUTP diphosphatase [Candidatus Acetothermia bacterium]